MPLNADFKKLKASLIEKHGSKKGTDMFWATVATCLAILAIVGTIKLIFYMIF